MDKILNADLIRVSLDGTEQFHDSIRNTPGAFKKAVETLKFLKSNNKRAVIVAVYTENSPYEMVEQLVEMARSLGARITIKNMGRSLNAKSLSDVRTNLMTNSLSLDLPFFTGYLSAMRRLREKYRDVLVNDEPLLTVILPG